MAGTGPTFQLNGAQRRALEAICDTFAPGVDGLPSATERGVPDAIADAVALNPREAERKQTGQLLSLWNTRLLGLLAGAGWRSFADLGPDERERALLSWADSRMVQRRAAFHALRKGALLMYYLLPGDGGNPVWDSLGYPGTVDVPPERVPEPELHPLAVDGDTDLDCDVCVVGSGAGGGTAAGVLAAAGLDVVVLEAGDYISEREMDGGEHAGFSRMYLNGGGLASHDQSIGLLAGSVLGGGTLVNYAASMRTPEEVRAEWAAHGVPAFASEEFERSLDAVVERIGVNLEHNTLSARERTMHRGFTELGWHVDKVPRNVRGCEQGRICGHCGYGCPLGAKQSTMKTWLVDVQRHGGRIVTRTGAERVIVEGGAARGVEARTRDGHRVTVRSRAVVAACGAIHTPALLRRSGLRNPNIGRHLRLHPAMGSFGFYDEELRPWEGTTLGIFSDEHCRLDGDYGVKYETIPVHPSLLISYLPWRGGRAHAELMQGLAHAFPVGVLLRDRDAGEVRVARDGWPVVLWHLSEYDRRHARIGLEGSARVHEAAGARKIVSSHTRDVSYEPGRRGSREQFMRDADAAGWGPGECTFNSFHIMGSARMGGSPAMSACSPEGETWDVRSLYVCDGSAFPTASGVNPMVSIEAVAHMNATRLAARLA